ncbi:MAG: IclR family transcriptional regulator C-terminal domain-containing protein [Xanthobacteraceae bacterium]
MATDIRLLQVLRSLNEIGTCTVVELHRATGISRQSIYRAIEALSQHEYVERIPGDSRVRLTSKVRLLSSGYRDDYCMAETAGKVLVELQKRVQWPSSLAIPDKDKIVVRETNRYKSPFVFDHGKVGLRLPLLGSALGLSYLAFCNRRTQLTTLTLLRASEDKWDLIARNHKETDRLLRITVARGYSVRQGGIEAGTNSIAVPVMVENEALASIGVTYAKRALTVRQAVSQFLPDLLSAAKQIATSAPRH